MTSRRLLAEAAAGGYALAVLVVVVAPAVVLVLAGARGGLGVTGQGLDLTAASALVGLAYAAVALRRLRRQGSPERSRTDAWLAAAQALSVLALLSSLLLAVMLLLAAPLQVLLADAEKPLVALWAGGQLLAVGLAELTERASFRWLTAGRARRPDAEAAVRATGVTRPPG